jgi:hypothetical protein
MRISRSFLLRMGNVTDRIVQKIKIHTLYPITCFENRAVYEIMWKNMAEPEGKQMKTWDVDTYGYKHTLRICRKYLIFHSNNGYTNGPQCHVCPITLKFWP